MDDSVPVLKADENDRLGLDSLPASVMTHRPGRKRRSLLVELDKETPLSLSSMSSIAVEETDGRDGTRHITAISRIFQPARLE